MPRQKPKQLEALLVLDVTQDITFEEPRKRINEAQDVTAFLTSRAFTDIVTFLLQLNIAMFPRRDEDRVTIPAASGATSAVVDGLKACLARFDSMIDEVPPEPGPRRFGNVAFKTWYKLVEAACDELIMKPLPNHITSFGNQAAPKGAILELRAYLLGSFGSAQRLDYGSGHELSFLAFLGCIWKLGGFKSDDRLSEQRQIVVEVIAPYLALIRRLITTYNLEPAGSHGVWGLDDHSFIPYILGSAQLSPAISGAQHIPPEGSSPDAPDPVDVVKADIVKEWRERNLYFGAIGFIYDVKKGPFWEHSPMLFDISGVKAGWAKINKGMIKMYVAEVLSKFPVVQHFPFGNLFSWEQDPNAATQAKSGPSSGTSQSNTNGATAMHPLTSNSTPTPWASPTNAQSRQTPATIHAPGASRMIPLRNAAGASSVPQQNGDLHKPMSTSSSGPTHDTTGLGLFTKAPWAK